MRRAIPFMLVLISTASTASTSLSNQAISNLHVNVNTGIYIKTEQTMVNPDNCDRSDWYRVKQNSTYEQEVLSVLLSAKMAGKTVYIFLNGCDGEFPNVDWVDIRN